jgi:tetratricopeptide (TPR) repeat protein/TolB-like protein
MSIECTDERLGDKLMAYELGMLSNDDRAEFELHLLECEYCSSRAAEFGSTAQLLRSDKDVKSEVAKLSSDTQIRYKKEGSRFRRVFRTYVPALGIVAVILILVLKPWHIEIRQSQEAVAASNRLVVLYFDNMVEREDPDLLGEIATNLIITDLSESDYVSVVSSQRLYDILKNLGREGQKRIDREVASEVAAIAKAKWMLTGAILQIDPALVISTQLIDVETGDIVSSHRVAGNPEDDVFGVIDSLTVDIKADMSLPYAAFEELDRPVCEVTTCSPDAYRYYLEGIDHLNKFYTDEAAESFRKALKADSTFAMAYYYLAQIEEPGLIEKAAKYLNNVSDMERYYIESRQAAIDGDREKAISKLTELLNKYPDEKLAMYQIGSFMFEMDSLSQAVKYFRQAIDVDPRYKTAYNMLAYVYNGLDQYDSAIMCIDRYIELVPDEANPYDSRGDLYFSQGKIDEAAESYQMALERKPDFSASVEKLGGIRLMRRNYEEAEKMYKLLLESPSPTRKADGRYLLAMIPVYQGKLAQGLKALDECLKIDTTELSGSAVYSAIMAKKYAKSRIYRALGDGESALSELKDCEKVLSDTRPNDKVSYRYMIAQQLAELGRLDEARDYVDSLQSGRSSMWGGFGYAFARASVDLASGSIDSAITYAGQSVELSPQFIGLQLYADCLESAGKYAEAEKVYKKIQSPDVWRPTYGAGLTISTYRLAGVLLELGESEEAAGKYEEFLDVWADADTGIAEIADARDQLRRLSGSP